MDVTNLSGTDLHLPEGRQAGQPGVTNLSGTDLHLPEGQQTRQSGVTDQGLGLETTDQGFLVNLADWNEAVARRLAGLNKIELNAERWEIIFFIRHYYQQYKHLPNARVFTKAIARELGETKGNSRYLHKLFPDGPLKYACKLAGLPKPPTCL